MRIIWLVHKMCRTVKLFFWPPVVQKLFCLQTENECVPHVCPTNKKNWLSEWNTWRWRDKTTNDSMWQCIMYIRIVEFRGNCILSVVSAGYDSCFIFGHTHSYSNCNWICHTKQYFVYFSLNMFLVIIFFVCWPKWPFLKFCYKIGFSVGLFFAGIY